MGTADNIYGKLARLSGIRSRRYIFIVVICLLITAVSAWLSMHLRINGDISALAPGDTESVKTLHEMEKRFGATNTLMVIVLAPAGMDIAGKLDVLAASLVKSPYVKRVDYRMDWSSFAAMGCEPPSRSSASPFFPTAACATAFAAPGPRPPGSPIWFSIR